MSTKANHFKWANIPMQNLHYYKVTDAGALHVNITKLIVSALKPEQVPGLAQPCDPEEFNQAITQVWQEFNAI